MIRNPSTPRWRATSACPPSKSMGTTLTPASNVRKAGLGRQQRPMPTKAGPSTTPHAIRAFQRRQAAAAQTPARSRRRSGRHQHQTPRDILRNLSKGAIIHLRLSRSVVNSFQYFRKPPHRPSIHHRCCLRKWTKISPKVRQSCLGQGCP